MTSQNPLFAVFGPKPDPNPPIIPPPVIPQVKITPMSEADIALANGPTDFMNKAQHEAKMNLWLIGQTETSNARKIQMYLHAYMDWKTNAEIYASCRPPIMSPPPPVCQPLEDVGPMPSGYWFGSH